MRYILEMDEEQAQLTKKALTFYARIITGQWNMIGEECLDSSDEDYAIKKDCLNKALSGLRKIAYPESYGAIIEEEHCKSWETYEMLVNIWRSVTQIGA